MSGSHRGSGRRSTGDTGQLCRCGPTLHCRGRASGCWRYARSRGWSTGSWRCPRGWGSGCWCYARSRSRRTGCWRSARRPRWTREQSRGALNKLTSLSAWDKPYTALGQFNVTVYATTGLSQRRLTGPSSRRRSGKYNDPAEPRHRGEGRQCSISNGQKAKGKKRECHSFLRALL